MNITQFSIEEIKDPTNIIEGKRYEFLLDVEIDEEDELYSEAGIEVRVLIGYHNDEVRVLNYFIIDKAENEYLDFALEDEEEAMIVAFCKEQLTTEE
ncbi:MULTISPECIES: DUF6509 family protein [Bacillales]|uniref:DUF6509 family protein n=1 Tax=Lysinibacillus louembei TaxID=1470088 RepID=A0ABZ0S0Y9_9BACI|nr:MULTISPECIES: DUF6509 family protein [Bacillales]MCT6925735.1 DUF6509 family protein [Metasolibacillus sp.]MCT6941975.1 DUF6509 family protein [Metasolibacillus sp.]WPK12848.1 DUF6509 family protein [Lysinibacillus louembei]